MTKLDTVTIEPFYGNAIGTKSFTFIKIEFIKDLKFIYL